MNEINKKKKISNLKLVKKLSIVAISAKNKNKKRKYKINKNIFYNNPIEIYSKKNIDILFEVIGQSDGISKKMLKQLLKKNKCNYS